MRLFKYMPKKFLNAFFHKGSLRIGTLYEYRKVEHYGEVIGDENEGLCTTTLRLPCSNEIDLASNTLEADFLRKNIPDIDSIRKNWGKVIINLKEGASYSSKMTSTDLYIYCLTSAYDPKVMRQFGCDACMEIINPEEFFSAISRRIRYHGKYAGYGSIEYKSRDAHFASPHQKHPAIIKAPEFSYQKEWRAIWNPIKKQCAPLFVDVPKARRHCRVYVP